MPKLIRLTTVPLSLDVLLPGQMRFMQEHGMDVIMVAGEGPHWEKVIIREVCSHKVIPMTRKITPFADLKSLWALYRFFKKEKPDIVHSHTPKAGLLAMLAARMAGVKIRIHTIAGLRFMTSSGTARKVLVSMEKLTGRAATHVWPNSYSLLHYIKEHKLVAEEKLGVIGKGSSNGINLKRYSVASLIPEKIETIKASIQYNEQFKYFVSVGRIVKDKGIDELLDAFTRLHEKNVEVRLVLVGSFEDDLDPISDRARQLLKTHPAILQPGWSDAVEYYLHLAFALVHPSHREGFPNVLLQAGALNCPVICSAIEGNIDIIEHETTGLLFEVKNSDQLYQRMETAMANTAELKKYSNTLHRNIEQYFDQPILHKLLLERYLQLIDNQP